MLYIYVSKDSMRHKILIFFKKPALISRKKLHTYRPHQQQYKPHRILMVRTQFVSTAQGPRVGHGLMVMGVSPGCGRATVCVSCHPWSTWLHNTCTKSMPRVVCHVVLSHHMHVDVTTGRALFFFF